MNSLLNIVVISVSSVCGVGSDCVDISAGLFV